MAKIFTHSARELEAFSPLKIRHLEKNNTRLKLLLSGDSRASYPRRKLWEATSGVLGFKFCFDLGQALVNDMIRISSVTELASQEIHTASKAINEQIRLASLVNSV